jgi:hypothetical protein
MFHRRRHGEAAATGFQRSRAPVHVEGFVADRVRDVGGKLTFAERVAVGPASSRRFCQIQSLRRTRELLLPRLLAGQVELASVSANGALSNQPGASPQVTNRKPRKG